MSSNSRVGLTRDVFRPLRRTGSAAMWMPPVAENVTFGIVYAPRCPASAPDTSTILVVPRLASTYIHDLEKHLQLTLFGGGVADPEAAVLLADDQGQHAEYRD